MLLTLLTAATLSAPPHYDAFLGLPPEEGQRAQDYATDYGMTPEVEATAKIGADTLVMWSRPMKGNEGFGLQVYGADGKFKTRLEDSEFPAAKATLCGRYIVGGGNTLRVWDAAQGYKLVQKRTFADLGQFAHLSCKGSILAAEGRRFLLPTLTPVDIRLGRSAADVAALNRSTQGHIDESHVISQVLTTTGGDTLVTWSRTAAYDPQGPRQVGTQVYGKDGHFKMWLKDTSAQRHLLLCGRYLVGGDNTLKVWDTAGYKLLTQKTLPLGEYGGLGGYTSRGELRCTASTLTQQGTGLRLKLPTLAPLR